MKKLLIKWLGLNVLALQVETLEAENANLRKELEELEEKVSDLEEPDMSDYVREDDINDRIDSYCNDYDIPNKEWIESEIEDKVQEAIDNAGIEEQVAEQVKSAFDDLGEGDKLIDRIIEEYENVQAVRIERAVQKAIKAKAKSKPKKK